MTENDDRIAGHGPEAPGTSAFSRASITSFARDFWQPPRAHSDVIEGREVSFLELFYDFWHQKHRNNERAELARTVTGLALSRLGISHGWVG